MVNRKSNSPWGSSYKEGLPSTAVNDTVDIDQNVRATITTGVIDVATGQWQGITVTDPQMLHGTTGEAIANGAAVLFPGTSDAPNIDMAGYTDIFIALKPTSGGNCAITAVVGNDDTGGFGGLTPTRSGVNLLGNIPQSTTVDLEDLFNDSAQSLGADVWNIFYIGKNLKGQRNLQFKVTNNTGGPNTIEFAFMRVV